MTNDCKTCPVSTGTHKPAEAVHQIDEPQADALLELAAYRFTVENREARIAELEKENSYLNNACAELEAQLDAIGAGGVEPLRKGFVRLTDVLARLEQGFGANSAPVTTIKRHFEMQAQPAHPVEGVPAQAVQPQQAMEALKAAMKADPEYAWSWHCAIWSGAHDEGLETGAANRAAARVMHMAFDCDTTKNANFHAAHLAATQPAAQGLDVVQAAKALCKHAAKVQNINFDDYWLIHAEEFKEEAQIVLDAAQAKQGEQANG